MELRIFQKGFNYSQDGPGNRLVYHLQGCNMGCPWCANPEGMAFGGGTACPIEDMVDEVRRSRSMFFDGGGVTFTGGEPTAQFEPLRALLETLKDMDIDTAIETNGTHPRLPELFDWLDHLMIDLKQPFPEKHRTVTGVALEQIKQNITLAAQAGKDLLVRIPMVNGYNTAPEDMAAFAGFLSGLACPNLRVELLRYHEYGKGKWEKLGLPYTVTGGYVTDEQYDAFAAMLHQSGVVTVRT